MANRDYEYYLPPSLRAPLREAGGIGYQLLDNLIGFDDSYDTTGEVFGRALRENPVGTLGGVASGAWEGIKGAVMHPIDTARGVISGIGGAYTGASAPLSGAPTREDLGQRLSDLGILSSLVPVAGAGRGLASLRRAPAPILSMEEQIAAALRDREAVWDAIDPDWRDRDLGALMGNERFYVGDEYRGPMPEDDGLVDVADVYDGLDDLQWEPEPEPIAPVVAAFADDPFGVEQFHQELLGSSPVVAESSGLVPTLGRAAISLEQPRYGSYDEVLANLRRLGAKDQEINQSGIRSLQGVEGPITKDMVEAAVAADNPLRVVRYGAGSDAFAEYPTYFTPGGENYREVVLSQPVRPGQNEVVPPTHFAGAGNNQLVHYRAAEFPISEFGPNGDQARAFHIGEIQSDWAQRNRVLAAEKRIAELSPDEVPEWHEKNILAPHKALNDALNRRYDIIESLNYDDNLIAGRRNDPDGMLSVAERRDMENELATLEEKFPGLEQADADAYASGAAFYRYWDHYDFDDGPVYRRTDAPAPDIIEHPVGGTNQVTTLALRQALADAAQTDTDFVTLGSGQMAYESSFGKLKGQEEYYDNIVPKQMRDLLKKLGRQYEIDAPELEPIVLFGQKDGEQVPYDVLGFRMTPELREAILNEGVDMFKSGGMVYH